MDPLTHALSGALAVRASTHRTGPPLRQCILAGTAAALFPDIDFALRLIDTLTYLNLHQGVTHSVIALPLWALLLAFVFASIFGDRRQWPSFLLPVTVGLSTHIVGDLLTAYGLKLFAPLSDERFASALAYVVDPFITLPLLAAALICWRWPQQRIAAVIALAAVAVYAGFLSQQQRLATSFASAHALQAGITADSIEALPQPFSPFNWMLVIHEGDTLHVARVHLRHLRSDTRPPSWLPSLPGRMDDAHVSGTATDWQALPRFGKSPTTAPFAQEAWEQDVFAPFRRFARLPVLTGITEDAEQRCAWFVDLRFDLPVLGPSFRFGSCRKSAASDDRELVRARGRFWLD